MPLSAFLTSFTTDGHPRVCRSLVIPGGWLRDLTGAVMGLDHRARISAPGQAPDLDVFAATWATVLMYRACQFVTHRDMPEELLGDWLESECPSPLSASTAWSVDLVLSQLPALAHLARAIAPGDPLLAHLDRIGGAWPLSSVGMPGVRPRIPAVELEHATLAGLYVDRIIEHEAVDRLAHAPTREAVAAALGDHPELSIRIARALQTPLESPSIEQEGTP